MFLMSRLLKIFIFCFFVSVFSPATPVRASSCSDSVPKPTSLNINAFPYDFPELNDLIKQVQSCGGAASLVPAEVLKGIYFIESFPYYNNPSGYACKKNQYTALGLMQIVDGEYNRLVPYNQRLANDEGVCNATASKFSRCNPADAIEIVSRALLEKVNLWDYANFRPKGAITTKDQVFNATGHYYGLYVPDQYTNQLIDYLPEKFRYPSGHEYANTLTYSEFVCAFSGFCSSYQDYPYPRGWQPDTPPPLTPPDFNFSLDCLHSGSTTNTTPSKTNPLRPNPFDLVKEEQQRQISDPNLALYCAQRPTVVKPPLFPPTQTSIISGTLYSNFSQLTTPLLSLSMDKPQTNETRRYLADYLEGRAYYETTPEPQNPDFFQQVDIFFRSGVFRKLAPASYQDQLKNAMIQRASGRANTTVINQTYGFPTATTQVHDYELNTPYGKFKLSQLTPKPLDDPQALTTWQNSTTAKIWPYVPMFTREDTKGFVQAVDEPGQNSGNNIEIIHPHLARTYEVSSALSGLLTPLFPPQNPDLAEKFFTPAPWYLPAEQPWWLKSDENTANQWNQSAPICDPQTVVYGSGDLAKGGTINTSVYKPTNLSSIQDIRYSPTYLITHTPFLEQIAANLITGPHAVFSALSPLAKPVTEDWPAAADYNEKNPQYSFSAGRAEAGYKKSGSLGQLFYKYLGSIICQEEKTLAWLQPFFLGQSPSSSLCKTTPSGSPGPGTTGTPIGPITSTCASTNGIFVWQSDPSWGNVKSPNHPEYDHCTIGLCGCGSASTTMILNSFGANTDVVSVWNRQHEIGGYVYQLDPETNHYYCMTVHAGPSQIFAESGLSSAYIGTGSDTDWQEVETFLNNCGLIYATGLADWPGRDPGGHVIVISGIIKDSDGKVVSIKTLDPGTSGGDGLIRTLGAGTGDYAYEVKHLWAVTQ